MGTWEQDMTNDQLEHPENWPDLADPGPTSARVTIPDEPPPIPNDKVAIQDLVMQDIAERKQVGIERYGTPLQIENGRDAEVDLYQELLDATMYARQRIEERRTRVEFNLGVAVRDLLYELITFNGPGGYWTKKANEILEEASRGLS